MKRAVLILLLYQPMTRKEFQAFQGSSAGKAHPQSLTREQLLEDAAAVSAAVNGVWRQRWDKGPKPFDTTKLDRELRGFLTHDLPTESFYRLVQEYVSGLNDAHAYVMAAGEELGRVSEPSTPVLWNRLAPDLGLIRIDRFPDRDAPYGDKMPALIDAAFAGLKDTQGLILDLRRNAGGDPNQANRLFDHLVSTTVFLYDEVVRRSPAAETYLGKARLGDWRWEQGSDYSKPRRVEYEPEPAELYKGKILVLADSGCVSAGEYVLSELVDNKLARFAGERTPGHSGSVVPARLPNSGLVLALPVQHVLRKGGIPIQEAGVVPQYHLDPRSPRTLPEAQAILRRWIRDGK